MLAVIYLQITYDSNAELPKALHHRLFFKSNESTSGDDSVEGGRVVIMRRQPLVVRSPLRGENWLASNGLSNTSSHRRTLVVVNGKARIAQRFATDWTRIGPDGLAFRGDPSNNTNWSAYGAAVGCTHDEMQWLTVLETQNSWKTIDDRLRNTIT